MKNLILTFILTLASLQVFAQCNLTVDSYEVQNINQTTGEYDLAICYSWQNATPTTYPAIWFNLTNGNGLKYGYMIFDNNTPTGSSGSNCATVVVTGSSGSYTFTSPVSSYFSSFTTYVGGANEPNLHFNLDFNGSCITPDTPYSTTPTATCDDGMMNGDETGVDCGGSNCDACCPIAGTPCDDGDPCTSDDVEDGNCNCAGVGGSNIIFDGGIDYITTNSITNQSDQFLPTTFANAKVQILVTNAELMEAGFSAGDDIIAIEWYVDIDNTTTTTFDLYLDDDYTSTNLPSGANFATGSPALVGSNLSDEGQYIGWHTATLDAPFTWDGTDNLIIQVCRTGGNQSTDDRIARDYTPNMISMITGYNHNCTATEGYYSKTYRPSIRVVSNSTSSNDADEDGVCDAVDLCPNSIGAVDDDGCVLGCTDATAHDFNPDAQVDNNSCLTCTDGIMNGDEADVDCGGSSCEPCECSLSVDFWKRENENTVTGEFDFFICYSWEHAQPTGGNGSQNIYFNVDDANGNGNSFLIIDNNVPSGSSGSNCSTVSVTGNAGNYSFTSPIAPYYFDSFTETFGGAFEENISFNLDFNGTCITENIIYTTGVQPTCQTPIDLSVSNLTPTSLTFNWEAQEDFTVYQFWGRRVDGPIGEFYTTDNTISFSQGVWPNTSYEWRVRVLCNDTWTDYTEIQTVTTPPSAGKNIPLFDVFDNSKNTLTSNVYPNPATNEVNVTFMSSAQSDVQINVLDITGRILMTQTVQSNNWETKVNLDISDLQNGYYFVEVTDGFISTISKLNVIK